MIDISTHALQDIRNPRKRARTQREWKDDKRQEMKTVLEAIDKFMFGYGECPDYDDASKAFRAVRDYNRKLSVEDWGR